MNPHKDQRHNNFRTKGSWKKRAFCGLLVETSIYRNQDLSLAKGWYRGKSSENTVEAG